MLTLLAYFRPHKQLGKQKIKPKYLGPGPPYCLQYATHSCVSLFPAAGVSGGTFKSQNIPLSPTVLWFGTTWWPINDSHLNIHKRFRLLACWDWQNHQLLFLPFQLDPRGLTLWGTTGDSRTRYVPSHHPTPLLPIWFLFPQSRYSLNAVITPTIGNSNNNKEKDCRRRLNPLVNYTKLW